MKTYDEIKNEVISIIASSSNLPIKFKTIMNKLELDKKETEELSKVVDELIQSGQLVKIREGKYSTPEKEGYVIGTFQASEKGFGFIQVDGNSERKDIFISPKNKSDAHDKDKVMCEIIKGETETKSAEGKVIRVISRGTNMYVGIFQKNNGFGFVVPDNKKLLSDIYISARCSKGAVTGEKVLVKIVKYEEEKNLEGEVIEILGHKDDPGVDILSIIKEYDVPVEFDENVRKELDSIPDEVSEEEKVNRRDFRDLLTVTIDGEDTKDIDDAVSISKLDNGNYKLGVHIADVTNYVKEGSELDKEALKRATSIYVVDRVIPMLPHKLSNGICSLNQGVDRLALSCIMEIDKSGKVVNYDICESLINVNKRMTYTELQKGLNKDEEVLKEDKEFLDMFEYMYDLSKILYNKRLKRGALEFVTEECKIYLDDKGKACEIKKYERNSATNIIEEFMLVCNETIAQEYYFLELPFVYRTHERPDIEKLTYLSQLVRNFEIIFKVDEDVHPRELQKVLEGIKGRKEENMISKLMLRSMKQAKYTPTNDGHFGLSAKYYCHFTSPIRRYPDLQIHRIIKENINTGITEDRYNYYRHRTIEVSDKSSKAERVAEEIEREVEEYKKCEYMENFKEQEFDGVISGITAWGIYVELDNTVEGLIRISTLDDVYTYDEKKYMLFAQKSNKTFMLGDKIRVKVVGVNVPSREIDFEYVES